MTVIGFSVDWVNLAIWGFVGLALALVAVLAARALRNRA